MAITLPADLPDRIRRHWVQGQWEDGDNACLHGHIRRCQPVPGDAYLIEQVANRQGWGTGWNDAPTTTEDAVIAAVRAHMEISDADLADTFGPQWEAIAALVRRAATLTPDDAGKLAAARDAARDAAGALVVRDLVGQHGLTQAHYDTLTGPWASALGPAHPDDVQ